jgi:monovalent cation:H+ antiporter-2, CPA2 family
VGNKWVIPKLLHIIAMTRNQELFFMSILLICMSIAFLTYELGMSLAFGAFLGGLMISDSEYSHNAFGNLIPFKDTFTSFFFVSIGMLLDLGFVIDNIILVSATVLLVIVIKMLWAGATAFVLGHTFRGTVMVGFALAQVGEFSFILAKVGLQNAIISEYYYQLFLAVAVTTMALIAIFDNGCKISSQPYFKT